MRVLSGSSWGENLMIGVQAGCSAAERALTADEHLLNFTGLCTPHYAVMPEIQYRQVESRISSAAGFFSAALVPFILDDVMQFVVSGLGDSDSGVCCEWCADS